MKEALLVEHLNAAQGNIITEAHTNGKDVFLTGIVMQADVQNRNGRIYPLSEMARAVDSMRNSIKEYGGVFGELDHPADRITVNLREASHVITDVYMEGSDVIGKMKLLDTPAGLIAKILAKSGVRFGVSSRGTGTVNEGFVSNFNLQTIDIVATPSAQGAYPNTIYESLQEGRGRKVLTLAEAVQHDPAAQEYFVAEMKKFIEQIKTGV